MAKRGRGGPGAPEGGSKNKKKKQTQQNGSAREGREDNGPTPPTTSSAGATAATATPAATSKTKTLAKGKGKGSGKGKPSAQQEKVGDKEEAVAGDRAVGKDSRSGGSTNSRRRRKKVHEEAGYEGPVQEESDSERSSQDGDDSSDDDSDDSDDEIKLDGAMTRRSDAEEDDEEGGEEEEEEEEEAGGAGGGASAGEAGDQQTVVDVCLDFCDPHERFFHGIRALVGHSYLQDAAGAGLSPLVDLAVAQGAVGTVLSTDAEGDAVFGFVTALPLQHLARENKCVQAVTKYLLDKASKAGRGPEMEEVLGESAQGKVGLLVSERMINCPMQAVPKLHEALVEDIAWAIDNEISEEHRDKFRFDKFIVVAPCDDAGGAGSGPAMLSDFYFSRFDDEVLLQEADFFFPMSCASPSAAGGGSASGGGGGPQQRYVVGVMPASKLGECAQGISQMVG